MRSSLWSSVSGKWRSVLERGDRLGEPPGVLGGFAEVAHCYGLAVPVADLAADRQVSLKRDDGFLRPASLLQGGAEIVQHHALATPVADVPADGGSVAARCDRFLKPARACCSALPRSSSPASTDISSSRPVNPVTAGGSWTD